MVLAQLLQRDWARKSLRTIQKIWRQTTMFSPYVIYSQYGWTLFFQSTGNEDMIWQKWKKELQHWVKNLFVEGKIGRKAVWTELSKCWVGKFITVLFKRSALFVVSKICGRDVYIQAIYVNLISVVQKSWGKCRRRKNSRKLRSACSRRLCHIFGGRL